MAEECDIDANLLISLVKQRPILWDKNNELYKNRYATKTCWKQIALALNPTLMENGQEITQQNFCKYVMRRWTHLRDNYNKSNKRIQEHIQSGNVSKLPKRYVYSKKLSFLLKNSATETLTLTNTIDKGSSDSDSENEEESSDFCVKDDELSEAIIKCDSEKSINLSDLGRFEVASSNAQKQDPVFHIPPKPNRHLSFFNGIIPALNDFDEDEVLEFQLGVLQLVKRIKAIRKTSDPQIIEGCDTTDYKVKVEQIDVDSLDVE